MNRRARFINLLGAVFGIVTLGIIASSLSYLIPKRPFYRWYDWGVREEIEEEKKVEGEFDTLRVENFSGTIRIKGWDRNYVHVSYLKKGFSIDDIEVKIKAEGTMLSIRPDYPLSRRIPFGSVSFDIAVPKGVENITAESISGSIRLSEMHPGVHQKLKTVSGAIETDNSNDLAATSTSGSIKFRFSGSSLNAKTVSGRIRGDILSVSNGGSLYLRSVSGSIHLNAPPNFSAEAKLYSISGSVSCDYPIVVKQQKKNRLAGKIGEGSTLLNAHTTSGSIRIQRLNRVGG